MLAATVGGGDSDSARIMSEIMEVPFPRADSRRLISFLTFQISIFFSASFGGGALILGEATVDQGRGRLSEALRLKTRSEMGRDRGTRILA